MKNDCTNVISTTLSSNLYPGYFKRNILRLFEEEALIIDSKEDEIALNLAPNAIDVSDCTTIEDKLMKAMGNPKTHKLLEGQILKKQYRYFCYFGFSKIDSDKLNGLIDKQKVISLSSFEGYSDVADFEKPIISKDNNLILIEFKKLLSDKFGNKIFYPIIVCFDLNLNIVEIRFDRIGIAYKDNYDFYKNMVNGIRIWIETNLGESLVTIDFKAVIEFLKTQNTDLTIYAQKMQRNKYNVYLESSEDDEITMPILGELKNLINRNIELFDSNDETRAIREKLIAFTDKIEIDSDIPQVKVRFDNLKVKVGISHSYKDSDFSLFQYYEDLTKSKEVVDDVREFFVKHYKELGKPTGSEPISS